MKEKKTKKLKYAEKSTFNENGELIGFSTTSSTGSVGFLQQTNTVANLGHSYTPTTTVTTYNPYIGDPYITAPYNPSPIITYTIPSYPDPVSPLDMNELLKMKGDKENKELKRKKIVDITRMNTLKELLDKFETCTDFIEIYRVIDDFKREYKKLAGIED